MRSAPRRSSQRWTRCSARSAATAIARHRCFAGLYWKAAAESRTSLPGMSTTLTSQLADLSPAAAAFLERAPLGNFIAGEFRSGSDTFNTIDPSTGAPIAEIAIASQHDIDDAVAAAR